MKLLGIDLSMTGTGVVASNGDALDTFVIASNPKDADYDRLNYIVSTLDRFIYRFTPDYIWIEDLVYSGKGKSWTRAELMGMTKYMIESMHGIPLRLVLPAKLKIFVTGKGNASKTDMQIGVWNKFKFRHDDDNVIDAYALMRYGRSCLEGSRLPYKKIG